jgi:probable HAF family extracellular repeat protein
MFFGINASDEVVGSFSDAAGETEGFLFTPTASMSMASLAVPTPEPGMIGLLLVGAALIVGRYRLRKQG